MGRDPSRHQAPASREAPRCRFVALSGADKEKTAVLRRAYSKTVRRGRVTAQKPKPYTLLRSGGKVNLVVSRGRKR